MILIANRHLRLRNASFFFLALAEEPVDPAAAPDGFLTAEPAGPGACFIGLRFWRSVLIRRKPPAVRWLRLLYHM